MTDEKTMLFWFGSFQLFPLFFIIESQVIYISGTGWVAAMTLEHDVKCDLTIIDFLIKQPKPVCA